MEVSVIILSFMQLVCATVSLMCDAWLYEARAQINLILDKHGEEASWVFDY